MKQLWEEVVGLGFYKDEQFGNSEQLAQQTAVDWLVEQYTQGNYSWEVYDKAKEMEKQQIEDAVNYGDKRGKIATYRTAEQYYTQTYGK
jgi:hypothetical protein